MRKDFKFSKVVPLAALMLAAAVWAQSPATPAPSSTAPDAAQTPAASDSAPTVQSTVGTAPVAGDATAPKEKDKSKSKDKPGTAPVAGDASAPAVNPEKVVEVGSEKVNVKRQSWNTVKIKKQYKFKRKIKKL